MLHRCLALAVLLLAAACASADERAAAAAAAHTCQAQFPNDPAQYNACVSQVETNIREARSYHPEPEHPQGRGRPRR